MSVQSIIDRLSELCVDVENMSRSSSKYITVKLKRETYNLLLLYAKTHDLSSLDEAVVKMRDELYSTKARLENCESELQRIEEETIG